jgi:5'-nucleotidase
LTWWLPSNASGTSNALTLNRPLNVFVASGESQRGFRVVNGGRRTACVALTGPRAAPGPRDLGHQQRCQHGRRHAVLGHRGGGDGDTGIPALAFSQVDKGWQHLDAAARTAREVIERVLPTLHERSGPWLLNVNIPNRADAPQLPRVVTRLGRRHASEPVIRQVNPRGETIYWIGPAGSARPAGH